MKQYDNYKDSGIEWIGNVPAHWEMSRLANFGEFLKGKGVSKADLTDIGIPVVLYGDIYTKYNIKVYQFERKTSLEIADKSTVIFNGDLLFTASGETKEDIGKCVTFLGQEKSVASGDVVIFRQNRNNSLFLSYVFNSHGIVAQKNMYSKGEIVVHIYATQLRNIPFVLPPVEEQIYISNYLDHKTTQIDSLIFKKRQFITLLQEERIAVINQAVTKGLDPKVNMKDSGIEWLGEIPAHWEVSRIKYVTHKIGSGVTPKGGAEVYETSGIPLLRSQNVYFDGFRLDNVAYISKEIHASMNNSMVLKGDVLLNITGGSIGRCYFVTEEFEDANVNQHVCIVRPNEFILTEYLYYILSSEIGQLQIDLCQTGGNREALNFEQLKKFLFALPSIKEQTKIISKIQKIKTTIDNTISKSLEEIELLKEYKTALISEVVTGKIDIR